MSIGIYSPGTDFKAAIERILWLRNCHEESELVRQFVSFSLFFETEVAPLKFLPNFSDYEDSYTCNEPVTVEKSFRRSQNLSYPINVARNIARNASSTHFVFSSDIELYPSRNFINNFFNMIKSDPAKYLKPRK